MKCHVSSHVKVFCLSKTEAAQFDVSWKVPGILYYAKRNYHTKYDLRSTFQDITSGDFTCRLIFIHSPARTLLPVSVKNPIDASVLLTEASLARKQRKSHATFIPLMVSEMPQAGDLVGLDAEFVTLNQVSLDYKASVSHRNPRNQVIVKPCNLCNLIFSDR